MGPDRDQLANFESENIMVLMMENRASMHSRENIVFFVACVQKSVSGRH